MAISIYGHALTETAAAILRAYWQEAEGEVPADETIGELAEAITVPAGPWDDHPAGAEVGLVEAAADGDVQAIVALRGAFGLAPFC